MIHQSTINLQLINHGVSTSLVEKVKRGAQDFFNLPIEEKKKLGQREGEGVEGYGQAFVVSEEQKLEWADMFFMLTLPPHLRKPYLFPNIPLPFRFHSFSLLLIDYYIYAFCFSMCSILTLKINMINQQ